MTITQKIASCRIWLFRFIQLQLFLTLLSLPILICWGIPFSLLSPLGNLIFGPALTLFLFVSSLLFFSELISIPNAWLVYGLEKITHYWLMIMHADSQRWLIGFIKPSILVLILLALATMSIMLIKKTATLYKSIIGFTLLFCCFAGYLALRNQTHACIQTIACNKGALSILKDNNETVVIDPGYLGSSSTAASWAQYTFMPSFIKDCGTTRIDHFILLHPSGFTFQALESLCTKMAIKNLYLVYWDGEMKKSGLHSYGRLKRASTIGKTTLHRIGKKTTAITIGTTNILLEPLPSLIAYQDITYPAMAVRTQIDNQNITIYSAKYINKNHAKSHKNPTSKADE
jgi:uncharacterized RDD family membrane protein YckC